MKRTNPLAALVPLLLALALPAEGSAQDLAVRGGAGGAPFRQTCGHGQYLVGFHVATGAWIDNVRIVCAPRIAGAFLVGGPRTPTSWAGRGSHPRRLVATCERNETVVGAISFQMTRHRDDRDAFVTHLAMTCRYLEPPHDPMAEPIQITRMQDRPVGVSFGEPIRQSCPRGTLAIGIHGRAGDYVDALGLICGPAPRRPPIRAIGRPSSPSAPGGGAADAPTGTVPPVTRPTPAVEAPAYDRIHGATRGNEFGRDCPEGSHLVAVGAAESMGVMTLAIHCAPIVGGRRGTVTQHMVRGVANAYTAAECARSAAVRGFQLRLSGPPGGVDTGIVSIVLSCAALAEPHELVRPRPAVGGSGGTALAEVVCPPSRPLATGIRGRSNRNGRVSALGIVCAAVAPPG
jgi:hypothetical protein